MSSACYALKYLLENRKECDKNVLFRLLKVLKIFNTNFKLALSDLFSSASSHLTIVKLNK